MILTIIGAGGVRTPLIIDEIKRRQAHLQIQVLRLLDIEPERLKWMAAIAQAGYSPGIPDFQVLTTTDPEEALREADFVITTFRVGGMEARVVDETVPLEYGVLGQETTGAGGLAMGLRTVPVIREYVELMKRHCPQAWLINFANPSGLVTEAVLNYMDFPRTVGICDGPSSMIEVIAHLLHLPVKSLEAHYFGLNHLGWFKSLRINQQDIQPEIIRSLVDDTYAKLLPISPLLVQQIGMLPNPYLEYYYHTRDAIARIRSSGHTRAEQLLSMNEVLFNRLHTLFRSGQTEEMHLTLYEYLQARSQGLTEVHPSSDQGGPPNSSWKDTLLGYARLALDLIEALSGREESRLILNLQNGDSITGMEPGDVVEIPALVSRDSIRPVEIGRVPTACIGLMKTIKAVERYAIEAALENSYQKAATALTLHPLVGDAGLADRILNGYLSRHGTYFPRLR